MIDVFYSFVEANADPVTIQVGRKRLAFDDKSIQVFHLIKLMFRYFSTQ
jgi:hypothetical protein